MAGAIVLISKIEREGCLYLRWLPDGGSWLASSTTPTIRLFPSRLRPNVPLKNHSALDPALGVKT